MTENCRCSARFGIAVDIEIEIAVAVEIVCPQVDSDTLAARLMIRSLGWPGLFATSK
jgi:hypothetical protein